MEKERQKMNKEYIQYYNVSFENDKFECDPEPVLNELVQIEMNYRKKHDIIKPLPPFIKIKVWTDYTVNEEIRQGSGKIIKGNIKVGIRLLNALSQSTCSRDSLIIVKALSKDEKTTIKESNALFSKIKQLFISGLTVSDSTIHLKLYNCDDWGAYANTSDCIEGNLFCFICKCPKSERHKYEKNDMFGRRKITYKHGCSMVEIPDRIHAKSRIICTHLNNIIRRITDEQKHNKLIERINNLPYVYLLELHIKKKAMKMKIRLFAN
jgi:hypothetical protein